MAVLLEPAVQKLLINVQSVITAGTVPLPFAGTPAVSPRIPV